MKPANEIQGSPKRPTVDHTPGLLDETVMRSRVRKFMDMAGASLTTLQRSTGLSRVTLVRACKHGPDGIDTLTIRTLETIANALGVRPTDLLDDRP